MSKQNCWEFMNCGKEPEGSKSTYIGVCPVSIKSPMNGINDGKNAGRICWRVAGSLSGNNAMALCDVNVENCLKCEFYNHVRQQEIQSFTL
ncbi:hypothetical protein KAR91_66355 [Candidatus Pacearchaeota archaeon]|nr:hypothetical protein [Candidatus Pacearchaeota archaeon]